MALVPPRGKPNEAGGGRDGGGGGLPICKR